MEETFFTRIPQLTDAELLDYVHNSSKYKVEAVGIAVRELKKRGHIITDDEVRTISENAFRHPPGKASGHLLPAGFLAWFGRRHLQGAAIIIMIVGLSSSVIIYLTAEPTPLNPLGYDPLITKKYLHEMELFGGTINVLATKTRQWFAGLWQGTSLAFTVGSLSVSLALLLWLISLRQTRAGGKRSLK